MVKRIKRTISQKIKSRARKTLNRKISRKIQSYVIDTSTIINKFFPFLIKKGVRGKIIIPNAVMAELENLANKGKEEGFIGLEQVSKMHKIQGIKISFQGKRPNEMQIRYAKSGEIDALIREVALKFRAVLVTSDLVQAKSAQAYGLQIIYLKPRYEKPKKKSLFSRFLKR
ncbi:MAG: PIN domain-containing protein [Nanoarchaeota archaeon]|nr:hypothetical protein [Nanoarchaeota archaeon]